MSSIIHLRSLLISIVILMFVSFVPAKAQQANQTAVDSEANEALREKAFELLESLAGQLSNLQSAENRARLGSNIAESLWTHDEQRARALFATVEEDIKLGLQQSQEENEPMDQFSVMVFLHLRADTVERIARHDLEMALAFLKATALSNDKRLPYGFAESERVLELRLAQQAAAVNPDVSLQLGRQSLERGFSNDQLVVLKQLNRGHPDQARLLYKDIVAKLKTVQLAHDWSALNLAQNLARSFTPPSADDSTFRELINIFITNAAANKCDKRDPEETWGICYQIAPFLSQVEKIDPRARKFSQSDPEDSRSYEIQSGTYELNEVAQNGTVDETLALLSKYPSLENQIQWQAMRRALEVGDVQRARKIATDYKGDPETRQRMLELVERSAMWSSLTDEKLGEIQRKIASLPRAVDRIGFLATVATKIGINDRDSAFKLLDQASALADTLKPGKEQLEVQMALALVHCSMKSDRGLSIMGTLVPKFNELVEAAAKLDGFDTRYLRAGEWNMSGEGTIGSLLTGLAQNASYFAHCDFDRSVKMAALFDRAEIRMMAQLKLAQGILAGPPKPLTIGEPY